MNVRAVVDKTFESGSTKAIVSLELDDLITIHDCRLIEGKNGLFLSMPSRSYVDQNKEVKHVEVISFNNPAFRKDLFEMVNKTYIDFSLNNSQKETPKVEMNISM